MSGIYIHIPFCKKACHYCDFHFSTSLQKKDDIVQAIISEIIWRKKELNTPIETIYFGGGTPSLLTIAELQKIIETIHTQYNVASNPEITLEANPDDLTIAGQQHNSENNIFKAYKNIGINRLSIGIQSFYEDDLQLMNRAHNAQEAEQCLTEATKYFNNITIDLIYGMPNMSLEKWKANIKKALNFGINHISSYALTVEPKTALAAFVAKGKITPLKETSVHEHFIALKSLLEANGFIHYELSNFGKKGFFSKHNTSYWLRKKYIGIGPSAHSFNGKQRSWNVANNTAYLKSIQNKKLPSTQETLSKNDCFNEYLMTGLRTIFGVSLDKVSQDFGEKYQRYLLERAQKFIDQELLLVENNTLKATTKGLFLSDGISADLFFVN